MKLEINLGHWVTFVQKNWFKLSIAMLGFYLFFIKQLSFQIQVQTPENTEQKHVKRKPIEKITENKIVSSKNDNKIERLEIPFLTKKKKGRNAMAELNTINESTKHSYLKRFAEVAQSEHGKYAIPASVILATAMLQSTAGTRDMTVQAGNHFGLTCTSDWRSACKSYHGYLRCFAAWLLPKLQKPE